MKRWLIFLFLSFGILPLRAQQNDGFFYQAVIRDAGGWALSGQHVTLRFSFVQTQSPFVVFWQEDHALIADQRGLVTTVIGTGASTGLGVLSDFDSIPWLAEEIKLHIDFDTSGSGVFQSLGDVSLYAQPYALQADTAASLDPIPFIDDLSSTDLANPQSGDLLKYNGLQFFLSPDVMQDTVAFAWNSSSSFFADSSDYVWNFPLDSVSLSYLNDSAALTYQSTFSDSVFFGWFSDTANYAMETQEQRWRLNGNDITTQDVLGTNDSVAIVFKSNSNVVLMLHPNGSLTQGVLVSTAGFRQQPTQGILMQGNFASGTHPFASGVAMVWSPTRSAFRAGQTTGTQADSLNTGTYSLSFGYNNTVGDYCFASGYGIDASGDNGVSFGRMNKATGVGVAGSGTSFSMGDSCLATGIRTVCIGRHNRCTNTTGVAIGHKANALGNVTTALGTTVTAQGNFSTAIGGMVSSGSRLGGFIWGDASATINTVPTANYMFVARADSGFVFYTDPNNTMGVLLYPGSGSWSSVSDSTKKKNIQLQNSENMLLLSRNVPVYYWSYKTQNGVVHVGPMAQDLYRVYGFGENETSIVCADMDGIILICIQGVQQRIDSFETKYQSTQLQERTTELEQKQASQEERLRMLEEKLNTEKKQ
jgi:hypothetical protein